MTTSPTDGRSLFEHGWAGEGDRLMAAQRRATERRLDRLEELLADPEFVYLAPTFVSA